MKGLACDVEVRGIAGPPERLSVEYVRRETRAGKPVASLEREIELNCQGNSCRGR